MREKAAEDVSRLLDRPGLRQVVEVAELAQATESPPGRVDPAQPAQDDRHVEMASDGPRHPRHRRAAPEHEGAEQFRYE